MRLNIQRQDLQKVLKRSEVDELLTFSTDLTSLHPWENYFVNIEKKSARNVCENISTCHMMCCLGTPFCVC